MSDADDVARRYRRQDAVYWERTGTSSSGNPTYAAPVDIKVRWEDKDELNVRPNGDQFMSKSIIMVGQDMNPGDQLWLGTVAELPSTNPTRVPGAGEVQAFRKTPDRRANKFLRIAVL